MNKSSFLLVAFFSVISLFSQEVEEDTLSPLKTNRAVEFYSQQRPDSSAISAKPTLRKNKEGYLKITEEDSLVLLIEGYKEQKQIEGYKIQIYSGKSKMEAIKVKSSFHSKYGESEMADIVYQQPNFKIRIGNYRDRLDANKWLEVYKVDFPSSFIVKDVIKVESSK